MEVLLEVEVKKKILVFIEITRPPNGIAISIAVIIPMLMIPLDTTQIQADKLFLGIIAAYLLMAHGMVVNDIFDIEIDRINMPHRVLPSGRMSVKTAKAYAVVLLIFSLVFASLIHWISFAFALTFAILIDLYNGFFKKTGFWGNLIVSFSIFGIFLHGYLLSKVYLNNDVPTILFVGIIAFFLNLSREILKGIVDIEGDEKAGVKTIAVVLGPRKAAVISAIITLMTILLGVWVIICCVNFYFFTSLFLFALGFIILIVNVRVLKNPSKEVAYESKTIYLYCLLLLVLFILLDIMIKRFSLLLAFISK